MPGRDSVDAMQGFVDTYRLGFPQGVSPDGSLWARFGVGFQPAWVFVNNDGSAQVVQSALAKPDLERMLNELIARP
jgi:hypothetical protein